MGPSILALLLLPGVLLLSVTPPVQAAAAPAALRKEATASELAPISKPPKEVTKEVLSVHSIERKVFVPLKAYSNKVLKVVMFDSGPPFTMRDFVHPGKPSGLFSEVFTHCAERMDLKYNISFETSFAKGMKDLEAGNIDIFLVNMFVTAERITVMKLEFAPILWHGSYRILYQKMSSSSFDVFKRIKDSLSNKSIKYLILLFAGVTIFGGHMFWVLEKNCPLDSDSQGQKRSVHNGYLIGVWMQGMYWAVTTSTTVGYGDVRPKTRPGRCFAIIFMMFVPLGIVVFYTASMTGEYTVEAMRSNSPAPIDDLAQMHDGISIAYGAGYSIEKPMLSQADRLGVNPHFIPLKAPVGENAVDCLVKGTCDIAVIDIDSVHDAVRRYSATESGTGKKEFQYAGWPMMSVPTSFAMRPGFKKDNPEISEGITTVIMEMMVSPTWGLLLKKYLFNMKTPVVDIA